MSCCDKKSGCCVKKEKVAEKSVASKGCCDTKKSEKSVVAETEQASVSSCVL